MKKNQFLFLLFWIQYISQSVNAQCPAPVFESVSPITVACGATASPQIITYDNGETGVCQSTGSVSSTFSDNPPGMCGGIIQEIWTVTDAFNNTITTQRSVTFLPAPIPILSGQGDRTIACGDITPAYTVSWTNGATGNCAFTGSHTTPAHYFGYDGFSTIRCDTEEVQGYSVFYCGTTYSKQRTVHIGSFVAPACPPSNSIYSTIYTNCNCALGSNGTVDYAAFPDTTPSTHSCCLDGLGLQIHTNPNTGLPDIIRNGAGCGDQISLWFCDGILRQYIPWPNPVDVKIYQTDITAGTPEFLSEMGGHTSTFYAFGPAGHQIHLRAVGSHPTFLSTLDLIIPNGNPVQCNLSLEATGQSNVNSGCDNSISAYLTNNSNDLADCPSSVTLTACGQTFTYTGGGIGGSYTAPSGTSCTISGSYVCLGQTCPLAPITIPAPIQNASCDDLFTNAYIVQNISAIGSADGRIYANANTQSCINNPISVQFYRDVSGTHQDEITIADIASAGGNHYFENLQSGKYVINFNQAATGCTRQQVLFIGIPIEVSGASVKNLNQ